MGNTRKTQPIKNCHGCPFLKNMYISGIVEKGKKHLTFCAHILISGKPRPETCNVLALKEEFEALDSKIKKIWSHNK